MATNQRPFVLTFGGELVAKPDFIEAHDDKKTDIFP